MEPLKLLPHTLLLVLFRKHYNVLHYSVREFVGQTSSSKSTGFSCNINSKEELKELIFARVSSKLKREVIRVTGGNGSEKYVFYAKETPTIEDLPNFIIFKDPISRRSFYWDNINNNKLASLRGRNIFLRIHMYGNKISSKRVFEKVKNDLFDSTQGQTSDGGPVWAQRELCNRLKRLHSINYRAFDMHWMAWAKYIQDSDPEIRDHLINQQPPEILIEFFAVS
jgi:hypothetical protein